MRVTDMAQMDVERLNDALHDIRKRLSRIHHDMNNPLSIVSGNIQLLQELSQALTVNDDFSGPLHDIEQSVDQLAASIDELMVIRNLLAQLVKED